MTTNEGMSKVTTVVQTSYSLTTPLQPSTTYYWQVEARDPAGNTRRTPYFSFTTGSGGTGGGEGNGTGPFAQTGVRKGVILHNPANPSYLVYVYINYYLNAYFKESLDGGATWTSSAAIPGVAHARDVAATMDDNGTSVALFICSDQFDGDSGNGSWVLFSQHPQGGSWTAPVEIQSGTMDVARRMPSVVRTKPNEYLFAYGYEDDLGGYFYPNDTKVRSFRWNGNTSTRDSETDTNLTEQADRPIISQQVGYDPYPDNMLYLFFQGAYDNEEFGDLFVMRGDYPSSWWHSGTAALVVAAPPSQRTAQGYLFRRNEYPPKDYVLILAMEAGPVTNPTANALIMRHADTLYALNVATDVTLETTLKYPTDAFSRYRTVYAAQDYAGHIHVVFQDYANTIKWVKINSSDYSVGPVQTLTTNQWLDSISVGQNKLYVSTISDVLTENNSASIIEVSF